MKKVILFCLVVLLILCQPGIKLQTVYCVQNNNSPIKTVLVTDGKETGTASLYGTGESYVENVKLIVKFKNFNAYEIILEDGYSPSIEVFDFGAEDKFLFFSSQTGGSGGYGNYQIYKLKTNAYELVYDDKLNSKDSSFSAKFKPNGNMEITNETNKNTLNVDVHYMDKTFYNLIFKEDGSLTGVQPDVNYISFVSPALNPASGQYRIITYRSIVAVAEVNRLGYIVQTLNYDGKMFVPTFTEFSIEL